MSNKKDIETEINDFLEYFDYEKLTNFLRDIVPLYDLYDVSEQHDWVRDVVGEENEINVRLIRTVYLMAKIAENHTGVLACIKMNHRNICERLEKNQIVSTQ